MSKRRNATPEAEPVAMDEETGGIDLPDSFEEFEEQITKSPAHPAPITKPMGGMVEKVWSGLPMWECPRCKDTTFIASEAKIHTCKEVRYAE